MKKLYDNYYKIEDDKPVREKVFLARIATSIVFILFCLCSMAFAAYGFYSADLSSSSNTITTASYYLDISVNTVSQGQTKATTEIQATSSGIYELDVGTYKLALSKPNDPSMASTGFASVSLYSVADSSKVQTFYTKPIGKMLVRDDEGEPVINENGEYTFTECNSREFTVEVKEKVHLSVVACWGSYSGEGLDHKTPITFGTASQAEQNSENYTENKTENNSENGNETEPNTENKTETGTEDITDTNTEEKSEDEALPEQNADESQNTENQQETES